jgi:hypothetical protein
MDKEWAAVNEVVQAALADMGGALDNPPSNAAEVGHWSDTITDHIVAAFVTQPRAR